MSRDAVRLLVALWCAGLGCLLTYAVLVAMGQAGGRR